MIGNSSSMPCTVCGYKFSAILFEEFLDRTCDDNFSLRLCNRCKAVFSGGYSLTYEDELYGYYQKYLGLEKEVIYSAETRKSIIEVLQLLKSFGCGNNILDVGCGKGDFVDAAHSLGYEVEGIELSDIAIQIAKGYGLPVRKLDFFSSEINKSSKDLVTMFEVIEHLPDPVAFLRRAEEVVKPGGLIYLTTPNFDSLDKIILGMKWDVIHPEHLTYFNCRSLLYAVKNNTNLKVEYIKTRNISHQSINYMKRSVKKLCLCRRGEAHQDNDTPEFNVDLRAKIARNPSLKALKHIVNYWLNLLSLGSTIIVILRRPK